MIRVQLSKGKEAQIDEIDEDLTKLKWCTNQFGRETSKVWYALRKGPEKDGKQTSILMHRVILERILGRKLEKGEQCDHINHDGLDNRRNNIRLATKQENNRNQCIRNVEKTSKYKGVYWHADRNKWRAGIVINKTGKHLGYFIDEKEAAKAYNNAATELFGEFAKLNEV
jgi:hypothetical protein